MKKKKQEAEEKKKIEAKPTIKPDVKATVKPVKAHVNTLESVQPKQSPRNKRKKAIQ